MSVNLGNTAIKGLFLGVNELEKIFLGTDLIYQKSGGYVDTEFSSCPFPTSWAKTEESTAYEGNNDFGKWIAYADSQSSNTYNASKAFDNKNSTYWKSAVYDTTSYEGLRIVLPEKILISPKTIYLKAQRIGNTNYPAKIIGYTDDGFETIVDNIIISDNTSETYTINTDKFYTQFELQNSANNRSYYKRVDELQIQNGTLRKEN